MQADYSLEIGGNAAALEVPWRSEDGDLRYFDLHERPELLLEIKEAQRFGELAEFLAQVNGPTSPLATAKCDVWATSQLEPEEAIFGAALKLATYVDLLLPEDSRYTLPAHEDFARALCGLLSKAPEIPSAAEFVIRRCYYHPAAMAANAASAEPEDSRDGYCITFYLYGYGDDEADARQRWTIGLKLVQNAILQISGRRSSGTEQIQ